MNNEIHSRFVKVTIEIDRGRFAETIYSSGTGEAKLPMGRLNETTVRGTEGFLGSVTEGCSRFELFFMSASMDYKRP